jgi:predicted RNA-binding Zn-ribbon protein involved in translation (DUF1610 family)
MSTVEDTTCPLCNASATVQRRMLSRSRHYTCPTCGELVTKDKAEAWLPQLSLSFRLLFSAMRRGVQLTESSSSSESATLLATLTHIRFASV